MLKKNIQKLLGLLASPFMKIEKNIRERSENAGQVFVPIFHDVPKHEIGRFRELLIHLQKKYDFLDPEDFISFMKGNIDLNKDHLLLTFDDAFKSNYRVAQEILNPLQIKAIFFIPTGFIDSRNPEAQELYIRKNLCLDKSVFNSCFNEIESMTVENLSDLINMGHTIGAHTKSHLRLSEMLDDKVLEEEIVSSGDRIEEFLGLRVKHFAYPFGDIGSISQKASEIARGRYEYIYSGVRGPNKLGISPGAIRREALNISDGIKYNTFVAAGGLSCYYWKARKQLDVMVQ
jgi:peptidoglycan/xylan/chitin deacetylase (PgdA/CDA1 family)